MITTKRKILLQRRAHGRLVVVTEPPPAPRTLGRVPRISRLVALAIHFDRLLRTEQVRDQSELARLARVTQPRMTQLMNLNHLAPPIQEELLHLPLVEIGKMPITERALRCIAAESDWRRQSALWAELKIRAYGR